MDNVGDDQQYRPSVSSEGHGEQNYGEESLYGHTNLYQSTGIEKEDDSRQSLENHGKLDEIRSFYNKKFEEGHDVHRNLASAEDYSNSNKRGEYQYVSGIMGIAYNPFLDSEAGSAHRNHKVTELLKFWTEKLIEIDSVE